MRRFLRSQRAEQGLRVAAIFAAIMIGYGVLRTIGPIRKVMGYAEHGVLVAGTRVGNVVGRVFTSEDSTAAKLALCESRLMSAANEISALNSQADDVTELQTLLGYVQETATKGVAARILMRSLPNAGAVTIDKGAKDGVNKGDAVVIGEGHLLGTVLAVSDQSSTVRLVHSEESKIPSAILGRERTIGLIEGQGGTLLRMDFIPEGTKIDEGNIVVTSGLDGALPQGIVIGIVTTVIQEDTAPFMEALVEPLYDAREWTNVLVISVNEDSV